MKSSKRMNIAGLQAAVANMLLDPAFMSAVRTNPDEALSKFDLSETDQARLKKMDPKFINFAAWCARTKRAQTLSTGIPKSVKRCCDNKTLMKLLLAYTGEFLEKGMHPWRATLAHCLLWLSGPKAAALGASKTLRAVATYERMRVMLPEPTTSNIDELHPAMRLRIEDHVALVRFDVDVAKAFSSTDEVVDLPEQPTYYLCVKARGTLQCYPLHRIDVRIFSLADGTRSLHELIATLSATEPDFKKDVVPRLLHWTKQGTLGLIDIAN